MIKNAVSLDEKGLKKLYELYLDYYGTSKGVGNKNRLSNGLRKISSSDESLARKSIDEIKSGKSTTFVYFERTNPLGFISGDIGSDGTGSINKFYVSPFIYEESDLNIALDLLSALAKEFQKRGISAIVTKCSIGDARISSIFDALSAGDSYTPVDTGYGKTK